VEFKTNDNDESEKEIEKSTDLNNVSSNNKSSNLASNTTMSYMTQRQSLKSLNEISLMSEMQAKAKKFLDRAKTKFNKQSANAEDKLSDNDNVCI